MPLSLAALSAPVLFTLASLSPQPFMLGENLNPPTVIPLPPPQPQLVEALEPGVYSRSGSKDATLFSHAATWSVKDPTYLVRNDMSQPPAQAKFFRLPCANAENEALYLMQVQTGRGATRNTFITLQGYTGFTPYLLYKSSASANAAGVENIKMNSARTSAALVVEACDLLTSQYMLAPGRPWYQKVIYGDSTP